MWLQENRGGTPAAWYAVVDFQLPVGIPYSINYLVAPNVNVQIHSIDYYTTDPQVAVYYEKTMAFCRQLQSAPAANNMVNYSIVVVMPDGYFRDPVNFQLPTGSMGRFPAR